MLLQKEFCIKIIGYMRLVSDIFSLRQECKNMINNGRRMFSNSKLASVGPCSVMCVGFLC
jgi:hypothetical protein